MSGSEIALVRVKAGWQRNMLISSAFNNTGVACGDVCQDMGPVFREFESGIFPGLQRANSKNLVRPGGLRRIGLPRIGGI